MRSVLVILLFFIVPLVQGQQLLLSPEEYISVGSKNATIIGDVGDNTVCFLEQSNAYELLWYDSAMQKIAVSTLDFLERGAERFHFYTADDALYVFYQRKKRKSVNLWGARIEPIHKDTIRPVLLDSIALAGSWDKTRFTFFDSHVPNRWLYGISSFNQKNNTLKLQAKVLNNAFNIVTSVKQEVKDVVFHDLLDLSLDMNDGVYALYGEPTRRGAQIRNILMGAQGASEQKMKFSKLDLQGYHIGDGRLVLNKNNNTMLLGGLLFKGDHQSLAALGGFGYNLSQKDWTSSNITDIYSSSGKRQRLLTSMRMRDLVLKDDNGYSIILEKTYEETYQRNRSIGFVSAGIGMASSSYDVYHSDEIVVFDIDNNGDVAWTETVIKEQETTDERQRYQSFGRLQSPYGSVFLFIDQTNKNNRFLNAFLSNSGELKLKQFTASGVKALAESGLMLRKAKQVQSNEIIFPIVKRGTLSFAKIIF